MTVQPLSAKAVEPLAEPPRPRCAAGPRPGESAAAWLLREWRELPDSKAVVGGLCRRLVEDGFGLYRMSVSARTLHPQVIAIGYVWTRGDMAATEVQREHAVLASPTYLDSPVKRIHDGATEVRRRIEDPDTPLDFPILAELRAEGITDYIALPLKFSQGRTNVVSLATDRPGGFTEAELASFAELSPVLALVLEVHETQRVAPALLETYLGRDAGRRVLGGLVRRGDGITIAAALWFCDLRGFTAMSEQLPRDEVIDLLNDYFGCMAGPVEAHGGEVLKFIGDGMLAIFPIMDDLDRDRACISALMAAQAALADLAALNRRRTETGQPPLEVGVALHTGPVMYGNIGAPGRLDFTVIGPAVNLVSRLQDLSPVIGAPLVASARFASFCGSRLRSIGRYGLKGIGREQEVFTLPDIAAAR